jgi:site-specific recombinase XerD
MREHLGLGLTQGTLKAVQELLGHRDIRTTMRYAHLSPQSRREAVEKLSSPSPEGYEGRT